LLDTRGEVRCARAAEGDETLLLLADVAARDRVPLDVLSLVAAAMRAVSATHSGARRPPQ
jgi:hypothetical protein